MITDTFLFYLFSSLAIMSSIMVVTLTNAVHSVLFLIIVFCNVASLLLILGTEFFSFMFLIVYVGAIAKINNFSILPIGLIIFILISIQIINVLDNQFVLIKNVYLTYIPWFKENNYLTNETEW